MTLAATCAFSSCGIQPLKSALWAVLAQLGCQSSLLIKKKVTLNVFKLLKNKIMIKKMSQYQIMFFLILCFEWEHYQKDIIIKIYKYLKAVIVNSENHSRCQTVKCFVNTTVFLYLNSSGALILYSQLQYIDYLKKFMFQIVKIQSCS